MTDKQTLLALAATRADRETYIAIFGEVGGVREGRYDRTSGMQAIARHRRDALEEAAKLCDEQREMFLSPEYATGQPWSSFSERFACGTCASIIRARAGDGG